MNIAEGMREVAKQSDDAASREMAEKVAGFEDRRTQTINALQYSPDEVLPVDEEYESLFYEVLREGEGAAKKMHVTICGMARDLEGILMPTIARINAIGKRFKDFAVVVIENDSTDGTKTFLQGLHKGSPSRYIVRTQDFNWPRLSGFEAKRVQRYATLRNQYREIVATDVRHTDIVLVVDMDCWGGWSIQGILNGVGWMKRYKAAACMASTSLFQGLHIDGELAFAHYDTWALRIHGWKHEITPWKTAWLPPPGAPPVKVFSAFGGAALYRPEPFFDCEYRSIDGDIEHAGLHRDMISRGWDIYLNPAQRSLMQWVPDAEGQHGDD